MQLRSLFIQKIRETGEWDILVIGGGATGLGIALDATSRGYKTLLLEQSDFAKGTSSRSTKLVHGGVRYLAQGDIRLVREASIERGLLYRNAPHLVKKQTFIIPIYGWWDRLKYTLGLKFYDAIAGARLRLGTSVFLSREETLKSLPGINPKRLTGGVLYHDGQFDDSRLAISLVQTIWENGGNALNYFRVAGLLKNEQGKLQGVVAEDKETGSSYNIIAKAVINATGVFADSVMQMDDPESPDTICVSQGVHVVIDRKFYPSSNALMIPRTSDKRVLFAVPWHNKVVLGTTDTRVENASLEPRATEKEISFILDTAAEYLLEGPRRADVLSVFAGLRPLAAPGKGKTKTREISRTHKIMISRSGLFNIIGGKWTTYRRMGEDMLNRVERQLQWPARRSGTAFLRIHGFEESVDWDDPLYFYGSHAGLIRKNVSSNRSGWISESLRIHAEQVTWAVRKEMAMTVEDVLARRTRALFLDAAESMRMAPRVADIMAAEMKKDEHWVKNQVDAYLSLASEYLL